MYKRASSYFILQSPWICTFIGFLRIYLYCTLKIYILNISVNTPSVQACITLLFPVLMPSDSPSSGYFYALQIPPSRGLQSHQSQKHM